MKTFKISNPSSLAFYKNLKNQKNLKPNKAIKPENSLGWAF